MLPGRRDGLGRAYAIGGPPAANATFQGGIAISPLGQLYTTVAAPSSFSNGFGVSPRGELCVGSTAIVNYLEGIPRLANGAVRTQLDVVPAATDPFLGGLRIGPVGGVYLSSAVPSILAPPENTVLPDVTGTNTLGSTLTCSTGTWTNSPSAYAYQWFQNNTPLIGQTLNTHVITSGDISSTLICRVTATNVVGGNQAFSNPIIAGGARYNYTTSTDQLPTPGNIVNATGSLIIRMNRIDLDGIDRYGGLIQLRAGDTVIIGVTSGVLANSVNFNGDVAQLSMVSWVGPANGEYVVTVTLAP